MYIINKYQSNNEILIFWINGISKIKFVNFLLKVSIVFAILQIFMTYFVVPKAQDYSRDFIRSSNMDLFSSLITEKKFIDTVKDFTIFVEEIDDEGQVRRHGGFRAGHVPGLDRLADFTVLVEQAVAPAGRAAAARCAGTASLRHF